MYHRSRCKYDLISKYELTNKIPNEIGRSG